MTYRDERDALKGRVEALEEELDATRKQLEEAHGPQGGRGRWLVLLSLVVPFVVLPIMVAARGPILAPPLGKMAAPFVCPARTWGSYVAALQASDDSSAGEQWELRCVFTDGTFKPAPEVPTWLAIIGLTEAAMLLTVGPVVAALLLRRRRRRPG